MVILAHVLATTEKQVLLFQRIAVKKGTILAPKLKEENNMEEVGVLVTR